jgi:hypothetical protein
VNIKEVKTLGLELSNPKSFLALLLFIGFVFTLFGKGWEILVVDPSMYIIGLFIMAVAVVLWILSKVHSD